MRYELQASNDASKRIDGHQKGSESRCNVCLYPEREIWLGRAVAQIGGFEEGAWNFTLPPLMVEYSSKHCKIYWSQVHTYIDR